MTNNEPEKSGTSNDQKPVPNITLPPEVKMEPIEIKKPQPVPVPQVPPVLKVEPPKEPQEIKPPEIKPSQPEIKEKVPAIVIKPAPLKEMPKSDYIITGKIDKGRFEAKVTFHKKINEGFYRLGLHFEGHAAEAFEKTVPGQFAQLDVSNIANPAPEMIPDELKDVSARQILLRRPFSFARVIKEKNVVTAELIYRVLGPGTVRMTTLAKGDIISVIGPLGKGFSIPQGKKLAILIAGGMGAPPLEHLAQVISTTHKDIESVAFIGAKTRYHLPYEKQLDTISQELEFSIAEFGRYVVRSLIATDDGTFGFKGTITACMLDWMTKNSPNPAQTIIYACGPNAMLAGLSKVAAEKHIDCQISMEEMMACGIGLCQSCIVKCKGDSSNPFIYKLCCKDGPVFDSGELIF